MFNYLTGAPGRETGEAADMMSLPLEKLRRQPDGALDFEYYRQRAGRLRSEAMRRAFFRLSRSGLVLTKRILVAALALAKDGAIKVASKDKDRAIAKS